MEDIYFKQDRKRLSFNKNLNAKNSEVKKDNVNLQKEVDYLKGNHPGDVLGRSIVNFKGNSTRLPQITRDELIELLKENGILTSKYKIEVFKEELKDGSEPYAAAIFNIIKDRKDVCEYQKANFISFATEDNFEFMKLIANDDLLPDYIQDYNLLHDMYEYATSETAHFLYAWLKDENIEQYKKEHFFADIRYGEHFEEKSREEIIEIINQKAKVYEKIQEISDNKIKAKLFKFFNDLSVDNIDFAVTAFENGIQDYKLSRYLLREITQENKELAKFLCSIGCPSYIINNYIKANVNKSDEENQEIYSAKLRICKKLTENFDNEIFDDYYIKQFIEAITPQNISFASVLIDFGNKDLINEKIIEPRYREKDKNAELFKLKKELVQKYAKENIDIDRLNEFLLNVTLENVELLEELFLDNSFSKYDFKKAGNCGYLSTTYNEKKEIFDIRKMFYDKMKETVPNEIDYYLLLSLDIRNVYFAKKILSDGIIPINMIYPIITSKETNPELVENEIKLKEKLYDELKKIETDVNTIQSIISSANRRNIETIYKYLEDETFPNDKISIIVNNHTAEEFYEKNKDNKEIDKECLFAGLACIGPIKIEKVEELLLNSKKLELTPNSIKSMLAQELDYKGYKKALKKFGLEKIKNLGEDELKIYAKFIDIHNKTNINELYAEEKRSLLRNLVSSNADLFDLSDELRKDFPLLPKNQEEYCTLLPALVRSLGVETTSLNKVETEKFNSNIENLGKTLSDLSDEEFNSLKISQDYSIDSFISNVYEKVKDLTPQERNKVYDYFGFELHHKGKYANDGFTLTGYPKNFNNGKKLAQIQDFKTRQVVEDLRKDVIRFSSDNKITCSNKEIEKYLNEIVEILPELRSTIGRAQHKTHSFDIFKHSLKVMQKVVQNPEFKKLNESDKKIMLSASLMHDISKKEGKPDGSHAENSSFDTFFIAKKFNLTQDEEIKLYTLIKNHEWLQYANTAKDDTQLQKRLQSIAYDLRHDNLFDMALIFTHADLYAVKDSNYFHDTKDGKGRKEIDGEIRSFGETADIYAGVENDTAGSNTIRGYINELKKSQPFLPVTKFPKASKIDEAIKIVNPDGSTNLKGIYKDKDGLVVIKFNEVENDTWEMIGFPKGSISKGIKTITDDNESVDTGNIKFLVHGLDFPNQLAKFDAFSLVDSDALLSVSYAERPESKYRFFRPQGIILDTDTKYIHGGGETDAGSGCGKSIYNFKEDYIFGGARESDRLYISKLIKDTTNMNDEEYIKFVKENENKSFDEIEPPELRNKIIKAFAGINSNTRKGKREYNEMYISNPKPPMGVFAYSIDYDEKIDNPIDFLNRDIITGHEKGYNGSDEETVKERTGFLREYALKHDIPFVVFGD